MGTTTAVEITPAETQSESLLMGREIVNATWTSRLRPGSVQAQVAGNWLRTNLKTAAAYGFLDGSTADTWLSGGCLLLADALKIILGDEAEIVSVHGRGVQQHALVRFKGVYLDGDGMQTEEQLLHSWRVTESVEDAHVGEFDRAAAKNEQWYDPRETVEMLADHLRPGLLRALGQ